MNELFSGPAADFDHPIEILEGCHQRIRRNCTLIERITRHLGSKGADAEASQAAKSVMRYFDDAGRNHHADEDDDLFPALERVAQGTDKGIVAALLERLRREHHELDALWRDMRARMEAVRDGQVPGSLTPDAAALFTRAYERHMEIEEASLFPLARRVLADHDVRALGEAMAKRRGVKT